MRVVLIDFDVGASNGDIIDAIFDNGPIGSPSRLAQYYIYVTQTVIGDIFMVSRHPWSDVVCIRRYAAGLPSLRDLEHQEHLGQAVPNTCATSRYR